MQPADISGKRQGRAMGAVSAAEAFAIEHANRPPTKRRVPMALHPDTFGHAVGITDDDTAPALDAAKRAYRTYHDALDDLYNREVAVRSDKTRTPSDHNLRVAKMAMSALEPVGKRADSALNQLNEEIGQIDAKIRSETRSRVSPAEAQEIRGFVRGLPDDKRREFLAKADSDTLAAVVSGKSFLSGLSETEAVRVHHEWHQREFPELVALRKKFDRARDTLNQGFERFMSTAAQLRDPSAKEMEERAAAADQAMSAGVSFDE